jgi:hypothetical protein
MFINGLSSHKKWAVNHGLILAQPVLKPLAKRKVQISSESQNSLFTLKCFSYHEVHGSQLTDSFSLILSSVYIL